jgi:hypothetical protein
MNMCHHEQLWVRLDLVSGRDQFSTWQTVVHRRLVYDRITGRELGGEQGDLLLGSTGHKRGSVEFNG